MKNAIDLPALDKAYDNELKGLQNETMRTYLDDSDAYENLRSTYVMEKIRIQASLLLPK